MSLKESIQQDEEELKRLLEEDQEESEDESEDDAEDDSEEESSDEEESDDSDDSYDEEGDEGEDEGEDEEEDKSSPTASDFARMRIALNKAEKRATEAEAKLSQGTQEESQDDEGTEEPSIPVELQQLAEKQRIENAKRDLVNLENQWADKPDDYGDMSNRYTAALYHSIRVQNPLLSHEEIAHKTEVAMLTKASTYLQKGMDPCESLYLEAKALNLPELPTGDMDDEGEEDIIQPKRKTNLKTIAKNKKKSAGMAGSKGKKSTANLTPKGAAEMSLSEFSKITPEELMELENSA